jgi:hypothetical protein
MSADKRPTRRARRSPNGQRYPVSRAEFNRAIARLNEYGEILNELRQGLDIQFKRIAQIQVEIDSIRRACDAIERKPK